MEMVLACHENGSFVLCDLTSDAEIGGFKMEKRLVFSSCHLVRESGEPGKRKSYLPPEKQYLITRNVPCLRRAASVEEEYEAAGGEVLLDNEDNDGWLATHGKPKETKGDAEENLPSMETLDISKDKTIKSIPLTLG
ncbi:Autophagy-related protein 3 [Vitis vinifera]|uniref:Autophagy-related protein 3 n=1 Tax=Vitis vinifera TaxID=29760 RepID=A0A438CA51_VITVI|nr:Autophagy-related protein 3 [Vitis vinifera]